MEEVVLSLIFQYTGKPIVYKYTDNFGISSIKSICPILQMVFITSLQRQDQEKQSDSVLGLGEVLLVLSLADSLLANEFYTIEQLFLLQEIS